MSVTVHDFSEPSATLVAELDGPIEARSETADKLAAQIHSALAEIAEGETFARVRGLGQSKAKAEAAIQAATERIGRLKKDLERSVLEGSAKAGTIAEQIGQAERAIEASRLTLGVIDNAIHDAMLKRREAAREGIRAVKEKLQPIYQKIVQGVEQRLVKQVRKPAAEFISVTLAWQELANVSNTQESEQALLAFLAPAEQSE